MEVEALRLAREVEDPALKSHFLQKAREWLVLSARFQGANGHATTIDDRACPSGASLH
jgi:hypothetical protein